MCPARDAAASLSERTAQSVFSLTEMNLFAATICIRDARFDSCRAHRRDCADPAVSPYPFGSTFSGASASFRYRSPLPILYYPIACFWHEECGNFTLRRKASVFDSLHKVRPPRIDDGSEMPRLWDGLPPRTRRFTNRIFSAPGTALPAPRGCQFGARLAQANNARWK